MTRMIPGDIARRFARLDVDPTWVSYAELEYHMALMYGEGCIASPKDVDNLAQQSCLLSQLAELAPEIVTGPLHLGAQYWVGSSYTPGADLTPKESAFMAVSEATVKEASTKPFGVGFFTSTGVRGSFGTWRLFLKGYTRPRPWRTWAIGIIGRPVVREITTAAEWVEFVLAHPQRGGDLLFPDWVCVARHYDAIHMTLRAIVATQGLSFRTEQGIVAPTYWDVESTLWLRWCFGAARLVEVVDAEESIPSAQLRGLMEPSVDWIEATVLAPRDDDRG
jgi:hypothetical protein